MIEKQTLEFLKKLRDNNNRVWFQENKKLYEKAKSNFDDFVMNLILSMIKFDDSVSGLEPGDCVFRIYRDTRFSKDKSPYKTNFGAVLSGGSGKKMHSGYYIHIEPGSSMSGGGVYMPDPELLYKIRKKINSNFDDFSAILKKSDFKKYYQEIQGGKLVNVPRGFDKNSPAAEYLKFKDYYAGSYFSDAEVLSADFGKEVVKRFKAVKILNEFLNV